MQLKKYGATSYEAKMAWEVVEKIEYTYQSSSKNDDDDTSDWLDNVDTEDATTLKVIYVI